MDVSRYYADTAGSDACDACPMGYYLTETGGDSLADCTACGMGRCVCVCVRDAGCMTE
jgi:hypothetical protein